MGKSYLAALKNCNIMTGERMLPFILANAERELVVPRDTFQQPEEGTETDREKSWKIKLKAHPEYFFWFRVYDNKGLFNSIPRSTSNYWGPSGSKVEMKDGSFLYGYQKAFEN